MQRSAQKGIKWNKAELGRGKQPRKHSRVKSSLFKILLLRLSVFFQMARFGQVEQQLLVRFG